MFESITSTDIAIIFAGFVAGTAVSYVVGKTVFNKFFRRQAEAITLQSTVYFEAVQQVISFLLGLMLGTVLVDIYLIALLFMIWLGIQTFLAVKIFGFAHPHHGLTFAGIDTLADVGVGALAGTGTVAFTLVQMALTPI